MELSTHEDAIVASNMTEGTPLTVTFDAVKVGKGVGICNDDAERLFFSELRRFNATILLKKWDWADGDAVFYDGTVYVYDDTGFYDRSEGLIPVSLDQVSEKIADGSIRVLVKGGKINL